VSRSVSSTLIRVREWAESICSGTSAAIQDRFIVAAHVNSSWELIETVTEVLIEEAHGIERKVLSKSLQEASLYWVGFDVDVS
jgi:hypothetical protein